MPFYFNDFLVGQQFHTRGRTITEADIHQFAQFTGDWNPVHTDQSFAEPLHGGRIAHGPMFPGIAFGMLSQFDLIDGSAIALRGLNWEFLRPVHIGDTIRVFATISAASPHPSNPDRGRVTFAVEVVNQHDQIVNKGAATIVIAAKPQGE
ncbi:MAG: MaoC/PaaZ C-terminal domain-containing protein [Pseudomonadota bacterium]